VENFFGFSTEVNPVAFHESSSSSDKTNDEK
jgi:hypothetical protein